jgi:hypothetical protein
MERNALSVAENIMENKMRTLAAIMSSGRFI